MRGMNYRHPIQPWIIAGCFLGMAILLSVRASQGSGPLDGLAWGIAAGAEAGMAGLIVVMKIMHDRRAR